MYFEDNTEQVLILMWEIYLLNHWFKISNMKVNRNCEDYTIYSLTYLLGLQFIYWYTCEDYNIFTDILVRTTVCLLTYLWGLLFIHWHFCEDYNLFTDRLLRTTVYSLTFLCHVITGSSVWTKPYFHLHSCVD